MRPMLARVIVGVGAAGRSSMGMAGSPDADGLKPQHRARPRAVRGHPALAECVLFASPIADASIGWPEAWRCPKARVAAAGGVV